MTLYALNGVTPMFPQNDNFWIAPDANVIGNVVLTEGSSVWFGATLRGDNEAIEVGAGTNIQENCVLHTDMGFPLKIGANCTIGHKAMLHGCTIGEGTLIGMGATVLNGAKIGKGCLIGVGALITQGKEIPDGSLVIGSPGKIVRELTKKDQKELLDSAEAYRKNMRRMRNSLVALQPVNPNRSIP